MMKALSLFLVVFMLALRPVFSQDLATTQPSGSGDEKNKKTEKAEVSNDEPAISAAEQADRDLLIPRKYQEIAAENANKPIKYGPPAGYRKTSYSRRSSSKRYSSKGRKTSSRKTSTYRKPTASRKPVARKPVSRTTTKKAPVRKK